MTDQIPDFEPPAPMFEDPTPAKKPRKKPTRRKAKKAAVAPPKPVKKRRAVKRRGRPPGAVNKPKAMDVSENLILGASEFGIIRTLIRMPKGLREAILTSVAELVK